MNQESQSPTTVKAKRPLNNYQKVVIHFVETKFVVNNRFFWANQIKIAKQLIQKYKLEFLLWCPTPSGYKRNSLVYFLTPEGQHYFSTQLVEYIKQTTNLSTEIKPIKLSSEKVGEDVIISKTKTLKEFLNYAEK